MPPCVTARFPDSPHKKQTCHPERSPALSLSRPATAGRARDAERDLLSCCPPHLRGERLSIRTSDFSATPKTPKPAATARSRAPCPAPPSCQKAAAPPPAPQSQRAWH